MKIYAKSNNPNLEEVAEPYGIKVERRYADFNALYRGVIDGIGELLDYYKNNLFVGAVKNPNSYLSSIRENKTILTNEFKNFFEENKEYIIYYIIEKNIMIHLFNVHELLESKKWATLDGLEEACNEIRDLISAYYTVYHIAENKKKADGYIEELKFQVEKAKENVSGVISAKEALESKPTEDIYSNAAKKYIKTARFYDVLLLATLGVFYYITSNFFENFQMISIFQAIKKSSSEAQTLAIFFFITKLTIVSIVITLATIFIRRSSHFRKLHDQANQTSLELNALPNYLRQVGSEHHSEIYKEMIPKFFGKELDQSQNDKVGDLMKDQLAAGTELIKASAEMVKNAKSLSGSTVKTKNAKSHSTLTEDNSKPDGET